MLTERRKLTEREVIEKLLARLGPVPLGPAGDEITDYLLGRLALASAPIPFWPLADGGWYIAGVNVYGRCPGGLLHAWHAFRAYYTGELAPKVPEADRHAAGKAIGVAWNWIKKHSPRLSLAVECVSMSGGRPVFDPHPDTPAVQCIAPSEGTKQPFAHGAGHRTRPRRARHAGHHCRRCRRPMSAAISAPPAPL